MLAVCRQHCRDRGLDPVLREADMTAVTEPGAYQAIIIPAGSIMLLDGRDEAPRALAAFLECFPGGRLILDVGVLELITAPAAMRYWERDPYLWTLQDMRTVYDPVVNQTTSFLRYEEVADDGLVATELQRFRLQYWNLAEFGRLLTHTGFTDISVTANYGKTVSPGHTARPGPSRPSGHSKKGGVARAAVPGFSSRSARLCPRC